MQLNCSTDSTLVTPLHTSDYFLITSNLTLTPDIPHTPLQVTFRRNLCSFSPSHLSSMVSSSLLSPSQFSALDTNSATDNFCSTLTFCLDNFCPFHSSRTSSAPWLPDVLCEHRLNSGLQRGIGTNKKTLLILVCISRSSLPSLQMSPLLKLHTVLSVNEYTPFEKYNFKHYLNEHKNHFQNVDKTKFNITSV